MSWVDTIMQQAVSNGNQETVIARDYVKAQTKQMQQELITRKVETVELIQAKLKKAREDDADTAVIEAYEKLLQECNGS